MILNYKYLRLTLWNIQETLIENKIERAKKKAKNTSMFQIGVNIKELNLTNEEKRQLFKEGYAVYSPRDKTILTYTQKARIKDIKEKILNKIWN